VLKIDLKLLEGKDPSLNLSPALRMLVLGKIDGWKIKLGGRGLVVFRVNYLLGL
jgi:hypothetical protein